MPLIPEDATTLDLSFDDTLFHTATARLETESTAALAAIQGEHVYQKLSLLGAGAMGEVHLVNDPLLQRDIAYKQLLLKDTSQGNTEARDRFLNEVKITAQLEHPYIVPIYCLEITPEGPAYTMKRVVGKTLKDAIESLKAPTQGLQRYTEQWPALLESFLKVCDAMAYAHSKGVLHRDLKPANIMLGDWGEVYLMDWGIARPFGEAALDYRFEAEERGQCLGTPRYMSPEQVRGANDRLDPRSDLFTLGLILLELLTLRSPYRAANLAALLAKVRLGQREGFEGLHGQKIPKPLQAIVQRATALKRADRYENVQALATDLRRYLSGEAVLAAPESRLEKTQRLLKRHRTFLLSGLCAVVLSSAVFSLSQLWQRQQALVVAQQRESERIAFLGLASEYGQQLDYQLMQIQHNLYTLGGHVTQALLHGKPDSTTYAVENREERGAYYARLPQPFYSQYYQNQLSLETPSYSIAYQRNAADLKPQIEHLQNYRAVFAQLFRQTLNDPDAKSWRERMGREGAPMMFLNVATPEGVLQSYPAIYYGTPQYDPRTRPFYKLAAYQQGLRCGNPYLDRLAGSLLPCSLALYDTQERFLGAVTLDMQFNYLARKFLSLPENLGVKDSYLVNAEGQIVVKSSDKNEKIVKQDKINTGYTLSDFDNTALQAAIQKGEPMGIIEKPGHGKKGMISFLKLNFLDWYFVVEAE
jgi:eukaryotic-like serine/threonine-protein kinase